MRKKLGKHERQQQSSEALTIYHPLNPLKTFTPRMLQNIPSLRENLLLSTLGRRWSKSRRKCHQTHLSCCRYMVWKPAGTDGHLHSCTPNSHGCTPRLQK